MLQQSTISPGAARKPSMDFLHLREEALEVVRQLAGQVWTDHNLHDPGITILEQICYALTDLGYRLNFSVPDLLADALDGGQLGWRQGLGPDNPPTLPGMPGLEDVLPTAPTIHADWQGALLDIADVRAASIALVEESSPKLYFHEKHNELLVRDAPAELLQPLMLHGLHKIEVDAHEGRFRAARAAIQQTFYAQRPAGEDLDELLALQPAAISLVGEIDVQRGMNPEEVIAEIFVRVDQYMSPQVRYKSRAALLAEGWSMDQILDGPLLDGGVLLQADLKKIVPKKSLHLSRIIEHVFAVPGVAEVRSLRLRGEQSQVTIDEGVNYWVPMLKPGMVPTLDPETNALVVRIDGTPVRLDRDKVRLRYQARRAELLARQPAAPAMELPRNRQVAAYQSIQHQFPDNYGINARGLPKDASTTRQAQAHQLKTWLLFFEQVLANYFVKAGSLGQLFQVAASGQGPALPGDLSDVPAVQASFLPLQAHVAALDDAAALQALQRFERLLSHLLARFGQEVQHAHQPPQSAISEYQALRLRVDKMLGIYHDLPQISQRRGQGIDLRQAPPGPMAVGGLKLRIAALLGLRPADPDLRNGDSLTAATDKVDFVLIEHILLRPLPQEYAQENMLFRFRNGKIHRIVRQRSITQPYTYRFKCYASGTSVLRKLSIPDEKINDVAHDRVEIVFTVGQVKHDFPVVAADDESFTIIVNTEFATHGGNPQGGVWNLLKDDEEKLYVDPWSLQVTCIFPGDDLRFVQAQQRQMVEQVLRDEIPAHLATNILWLGKADMQSLCHHYFEWRHYMAQYLHDRVEGSPAGERYVQLRHHRNQLMRFLFVGETEPVRDLEICLLPAAGITSRIGAAGELVVELARADKKDLHFELPVVEAGVEYAWVDPAVSTAFVIPYAVQLTTQTMHGEGLHILLRNAQYPIGESHWAIYATDANQQTANLLHQKITIIVS